MAIGISHPTMALVMSPATYYRGPFKPRQGPRDRLLCKEIAIAAVAGDAGTGGKPSYARSRFSVKL
jgi:hypothetical protein